MMKYEFILQGGLGNQLFIALEAVRFKRLYLEEICINTADFKKNKVRDRGLCIHKLMPGLLNYFSFYDDRYAEARLMLAKIKGRLFAPSIASNRLPGDATLVSNWAPGYRSYRAYFQYVNNSSIDECALSLMRDFFSEHKTKKVNKLAVHVRRGDYLLPQHAIHGLISVDAIVNEVRNALSMHQYSGVTIFTDSPELITSDIFSDLGVDVEIDPGGSPIDVIIRMASHLGILAANSSFSLWAGLLGEPDYFSIPEFWMPGIESNMFNIKNAKRYSCTL